MTHFASYSTTKPFQQLMAASLDNLCSSKPAQVPFIKNIQEMKLHYSEPCSDWLITDDNIREETDRHDGINVSFNFALCWLRTEQQELI